ncbi:hypothetical protein J6590_051144 [Homalodisca vitripennis]|nr:hypothetical protein J6590_051144 [Homalodisca vitripennis]
MFPIISQGLLKMPQTLTVLPESSCCRSSNPDINGDCWNADARIPLYCPEPHCQGSYPLMSCGALSFRNHHHLSGSVRLASLVSACYHAFMLSGSLGLS